MSALHSDLLHLIAGSFLTEVVAHAIHHSRGKKQQASLNNLVLMHQPTLPYDRYVIEIYVWFVYTCRRLIDLSNDCRYRVHQGEDSETQVQWRTLVWRQFALLALDLPFPFMAALALWRAPQLCREVHRKKLLYERWQRCENDLYFVLKPRNCALKTRKSVLKMMYFAGRC